MSFLKTVYFFVSCSIIPSQLRTLPVQSDAVQPGAGAAREVGEETAGVGGDEGRAPAPSSRSVHRPVICDELQLVQPAPTAALHDDDLGPGVQLVGVKTPTSSTVICPPHVTVLSSQRVHLRSSPELNLRYHPVKVNLSPVSPEAASVTSGFSH